jgi:hypothetical protein
VLTISDVPGVPVKSTCEIAQDFPIKSGLPDHEQGDHPEASRLDSRGLKGLKWADRVDLPAFAMWDGMAIRPRLHHFRPFA